ncbi:PREDICTED: uncharacterized protein LOC108365512 [Rhagoletis zephyria]|uniref:uncharacterized protein LOC108365512 n=1 Tax=Rhagoletis zephyria TaxID=28612 RepID=UPI000811841A|nr:PREDICTED: uncharacterized protein LOC108365512 [Rhagoletis zephyria]
MRNTLYLTLCLWFLLATCTHSFVQARHRHKGQGSTAATTIFQCQTPGYFPDPYNCQNYYKCQSGGTYTRYKCGSRQRYSVQMQSCALSSNVVCYDPAFRCTAVGDQGAWPGDSRIFYTCQASGSDGRLQPVLFKCPDGTSFDGAACA